MTKKRICIITGANSGIGKQAALKIADEGYHVILACRSAERARDARNDIVTANPGRSVESMLVDMGSQHSIREFAARIIEKYPQVDVLIHNAALFNVTQREQQKTPEGVESIWSVNHLGPVLLTELLLDRLKASANGRVITISSQGLVAMPRLRVDLGDPEFNARKFSVTKAYYQSKRAQVMYTYWLADRLAGTRVSANCIRVSAVKVDLARHPDLSAFKRWVYSVKSRMSLSPAEMARTYCWLATSDDLAEVSGRYFNEKNVEVSSVPYTRDKENITAVISLTASYIPELEAAIVSDE